MVEKWVKISGKAPPPFSGNARKKLIFLLGGVPLSRTFSSLDDDLDLECRSGGLERKCWVARRAPTPSWVSPRLSGLSITMIIINFLSKKALSGLAQLLLYAIPVFNQWHWLRSFDPNSRLMIWCQPGRMFFDLRSLSLVYNSCQWEYLNVASYNLIMCWHRTDY